MCVRKRNPIEEATNVIELSDLSLFAPSPAVVDRQGFVRDDALMRENSARYSNNNISVIPSSSTGFRQHRGIAQVLQEL